jgi:hypothetical protein
MQDGKPVIYDTKRFRSDKVAYGTKIMGWLDFDAAQGAEVEVKVAISSTGTSGAFANLKELDNLNFDSLRKKGKYFGLKN